MRKNLQETEISKQQILAAAEKVFIQNGFRANMDEIAAITGMTKGAIFWHYGSKLGLFQAVLEKSARRLREIISRPFETNENILQQCQKMVLNVLHDQSFSVLIHVGNLDSERGIAKGALDNVSREVAACFNEMHKKLNQAQKRGELKQDADVMNLLVVLTLFMSSFPQMDKIKHLLKISQNWDEETAIRTLFKGLNSFGK